MKNDFPIFNSGGLIYLDSASTTQKPKVVIDSLKNFYEKNNANVHRGVYKLSEKATEEYENAREKIANFLGANTREIIFTKNCTEAINILAYSLSKDFKEGDEIILTVMEHHSNLVPWQQIAKEKRMKLQFLGINEQGELNLEELKGKLNEKTKIVSVTHISNVLGTINPIRKIAKIVKENSDARLVVDAAQSVGHTKIDVKNLGVDFLALSGHKMLGPNGIGCLYGREELLEEMGPFNYGGDMIKEVRLEDSEFNEIPWKFEAGTPPIANAIALGQAVDYLQEVGMEKLEEKEKNVIEYAMQSLKAIEKIKIYGPVIRGPIISFNVGKIHPHDVATILDNEGIAVRGGHHCCMPLMKILGKTGTVRISLGPYNDKEDIDTLIEGIKKVKEVFRE